MLLLRLSAVKQCCCGLVLRVGRVSAIRGTCVYVVQSGCDVMITIDHIIMMFRFLVNNCHVWLRTSMQLVIRRNFVTFFETLRTYHFYHPHQLTRELKWYMSKFAKTYSKTRPNLFGHPGCSITSVIINWVMNEYWVAFTNLYNLFLKLTRACMK